VAVAVAVAAGCRTVLEGGADSAVVGSGLGPRLLTDPGRLNAAQVEQARAHGVSARHPATWLATRFTAAGTGTCRRGSTGGGAITAQWLPSLRGL